MTLTRQMELEPSSVTKSEPPRPSATHTGERESGRATLNAAPREALDETTRAKT